MPTRRAFGNVRQLDSGRFQARLTGDGEGWRNPFPRRTFATREEAEEALDDLAYETRHRTAIDARTDRLFAEWVVEWADEFYQPHVYNDAGEIVVYKKSPRTRSEVLDDVIPNMFLRSDSVLNDVTVAGIDYRLVTTWVNQLPVPWVDDDGGKEHPGCGHARREKGLKYLRKALKEARLAGMRSDNPATDVTLPPRAATHAAQQRRRHYLLYCTEIAKIVAQGPLVQNRQHEDWGLFYDVLAWSGMRPQEVRALWPSQVIRGRQTIRVDAAISDARRAEDSRRSSTKSGAARHAYLPSAVAEALEKRIKDRGIGDYEYIFPFEDGVRFMAQGTHTKQGWHPMRKAAGVGADLDSLLQGRRQVPVSYDLRASLISHLLSAGVPEVDVRAQVGHADENVTRLYTEVQHAHAEDPLVLRARSAVTPATRGDVIEYLYTEAQAALDEQ